MRATPGGCLCAALFFLNLVTSCLSNTRKFPPGFLIGTSTAAYQIEGAWNASGESLVTKTSLIGFEFYVSDAVAAKSKCSFQERKYDNPTRKRTYVKTKGKKKKLETSFVCAKRTLNLTF